MTSAVILHRVHQRRRILAVRLKRAEKQTLPLSDWVKRYRPGVTVTDLGAIGPGQTDDHEFDVVFLMASGLDISEAAKWKERIRPASSRRILLSIAHDPDRLHEAGWDAVFVNRSGRLDAPLPLLLREQGASLDDDLLYDLLAGGDAIVSTPSVENVGNPFFSRGAAAAILHVNVGAPLTADGVSALFDRVRLSGSAGCEWRLSVSQCCGTVSNALVIAVQPSPPLFLRIEEPGL